MPPIINLGGLVLSTIRLAFVVAIITGFVVSRWIVRRDGGHARSTERTAEILVLALVLFARIGFVAKNWPAYQSSPLSALYFWQPGYDVLSGAVGATAFFAVCWLVSRRQAIVVARGFGIPLLAFLAFALLTPAWQTTGNIRSGDRAPELVMADLQGDRVALAATTGHPTVVNIWATWCLPCREEIPLLNQAYDHFADQHFTLIGVNLSESASTVRRFVAQQPVAYPVWIDPQGAERHASPSRSLFHRVGAMAVPTTLFIDCSGHVEQVVVGRLDPGTLYSGINRILC